VFFYRGQPDAIRTLADYVIQHHYPELNAYEDKYPRFLQAVVVATAKLMAQWQAVGFAHGVMNTDNMSILGLTLDYGPFGFLDHYDPGFICNHSDQGGRYAFDQQPECCGLESDPSGASAYPTDERGGLPKQRWMSIQLFLPAPTLILCVPN
jgi:Uncharacterized conserved protein